MGGLSPPPAQGNYNNLKDMTEEVRDCIYAGHLTGCGGADPHNSLMSASSAFSEHFLHKTEKFP